MKTDPILLKKMRIRFSLLEALSGQEKIEEKRYQYYGSHQNMKINS